MAVVVYKLNLDLQPFLAFGLMMQFMKSLLRPKPLAI
jgi:hypothetical protein